MIWERPTGISHRYRPPYKIRSWTLHVSKNGLRADRINPLVGIPDFILLQNSIRELIWGPRADHERLFRIEYFLDPVNDGFKMHSGCAVGRLSQSRPGIVTKLAKFDKVESTFIAACEHRIRARRGCLRRCRCHRSEGAAEFRAVLQESRRML